MYANPETVDFQLNIEVMIEFGNTFEMGMASVVINKIEAFKQRTGAFTQSKKSLQLTEVLMTFFKVKPRQLEKCM